MTLASNPVCDVAASAMAMSRLATFNDYQGDDAARGNCAWGLRRLPHGHVGHVEVHVNLKDRAPVLSKSVQTSPCKLGAGLGRRPFHQSFHWSRFPSRAVTIREVSCFRALPRVNSSRIRACKPFARQSLAHKQVIQAVAYGPHLNRLSSFIRLAGFKPSEALNGRVPNTTGAFHKNEGELPNVCC